MCGANYLRLAQERRTKLKVLKYVYTKFILVLIVALGRRTLDCDSQNFDSACCVLRAQFVSESESVLQANQYKLHSGTAAFERKNPLEIHRKDPMCTFTRVYTMVRIYLIWRSNLDSIRVVAGDAVVCRRAEVFGSHRIQLARCVYVSMDMIVYVPVVGRGDGKRKRERAC